MIAVSTSKYLLLSNMYSWYPLNDSTLRTVKTSSYTGELADLNFNFFGPALGSAITELENAHQWIWKEVPL